MENKSPENTGVQVEVPGQGMCGIIMPMSSADDYTEEHWIQIRTLIEDAANEAKFKARIVSTNANPGILQSNLVTNIYQDEIVVCDVSNRNPNVMLELGMRIAFGKPFIVIKDTDTTFASDINVVIHELYDRHMLYPEAKRFKSKLATLISEQAKAARSPSHKSFLSTFKVPDISLEDIKSSTIGVKELLTELVSSVEQLKREVRSGANSDNLLKVEESFLSEEDKAYIRQYVALLPTPQEQGINHHIFYMQKGVTGMLMGGKIAPREELSKRSFSEIHDYIKTLGLEPSRLFFNA